MLSLGPVQDFIATARRTRDLYAGSRLLSEAAQQVARHLAGEVGEEQLIFPAPGGEVSLEELGKAGIPNVILALVPEGKDPKALGEKALEAARAYLKAKAMEVFRGRQDHLFLDTALAQVEDLLEGYYAYAPLGAKEDYASTRGRVAALLAARKNTRDFAQVTWGSAAFKSSLDGARESVLLLPDKPEEANRARVTLGLRPGEYLSGPDLLKRWWPVGEGFVSTTHMAALPFWEGAKARGLEGRVREALAEVARLVGEEARSQTWHPVLRDTPFGDYDVRLLYETRLEEFTSLAEDPSHLEAVRKRLQTLWAELRQKGLPPPGTYYALLHADGDRMGETLDGLQNPEAHRAFSNALAREFALKVKGIVERHGGGLVYSGGDDVLALLPLHRALACARALAERFREVMAPYGKGGVLPSLSVGLAVVHHLEPLQDALDLARRAEKKAKEDQPKRNALAVIYSPRSGSELAVRGRWDESPRLTQRLLRYADLIRLEAVPSRAAYELKELIREAGDVLSEEALVAEAMRILKRKEMKEAYREELAHWIRTKEHVERLAHELILARPFAEAMEQAGVPVESREVWDAH